MNISDIENKLKDRPVGVIGRKKEFSVLIPLCEVDGETCILFEVRSRDIRQPGDVCLPGGKIENGESIIECALRETEEETGIPQTDIRVLGRFDSMLEVNRVRMHTVVGELPKDFNEKLSPDPKEVAEVFTVPLSFFKQNKPAYYNQQIIQDTEGFPFEEHGISSDYNWRKAYQDVFFWHYKGHAIWGLTSGIIEWFISQLAED